MSLNWTIDSRARLVTVVADGSVSRSDVEQCLKAVRGANASSYRKLVDCRKLALTMDGEELLATGYRIRERHGKPMGPLAVILPSVASESLNRLLGFFAAADRPMKLFRSRRSALRWLEEIGAR